MIVLVQDLIEHFIILFPRAFISIVASSVFDSHLFPFYKHSRYTLPTFTNVLSDGSVANVLPHSIHIKSLILKVILLHNENTISLLSFLL